VRCQARLVKVVRTNRLIPVPTLLFRLEADFDLKTMLYT
jgi:hypothetical protein